MSATTLFEKIWAAHQVQALPGDRAALVIDRMTLHELSGGYALRDMRVAGETPRLRVDQIFAVADHAISTAPDRGRHDSLTKTGSEMIASLEKSCVDLGYRYASPDDVAHGIVHVSGPEQGFILPGITHVCGDSHTCTVGAFGALAFAVGSSEVATVLRRGALIVQRPGTLRMTLSGNLADGVVSKDVALRILAEHGMKLALGYVIEFTGEVVSAMSMEARMTLCNMAAEMGTRYALIAPDETTFDYLRKVVPATPEIMDAAIANWRALRSDPDAAFDGEISLDVGTLAPQVTWGTSPMHAIAVNAVVPHPDSYAAPSDHAMATKALAYMQLQPGQALADITIDAAFIGSCTNSRISDLRAAASILKGRKIATGVRAMCTPGSMQVRAQAEAEGIAAVFRDAGFEWRKSGCSNCAGREGPIWQDMRVISSTNRNFENRQGPRTRTHLASPATVAASAIAGRIADPREFMPEAS